MVTVNDVLNFGDALVKSVAYVFIAIVIDLGATPAEDNVCLIVITPVDGLTQGHGDHVAFDRAFYPALAEIVAAAVQNVLQINLTLIAIHDVALAALLTRIEATAHVNGLTRTDVGLEFTLGPFGNNSF